MREIIDPHTHTIMSGHAYSTIKEMATAAANKGIEILGITDHGPQMEILCGQEYFMNFDVIDRDAYGPRLIMGVEADILDENGSLDVYESTLSAMDLVITSFHKQCYRSRSKEENTRAMIEAAKKPFTTILGHPDDGKFPVDFSEVVRAAVNEHVLLEVNNRSLTPKSFRLHGEKNCIAMLDQCVRFNAMVIMSSDAHVDTEVGEFRYAKALLKKIGFPSELIINYNREKLLSYFNMKVD